MQAIDYLLLALLAVLFLAAALYGARKKKCGVCSGQCGGCAMAGSCSAAGAGNTPMPPPPAQSNHQPYHETPQSKEKEPR